MIDAEASTWPSIARRTSAPPKRPSSGTRPSFTPAAPPADGERLFARFVEQARARHPQVAAGVFGAHMQVELTNDGPVTFWLQVKPRELH